jgi:hypothetical protein
MSTRRGLTIVLGLIALVISGVILDAYGQDRIRCESGYCVIALPLLRELQQQAAAAERYAAMCNWPKR